MTTYLATPVQDGDDFTTILWGTLIFLALFVVGFGSWKAFDWLRTRREHRRTGRSEITPEPSDHAVYSHAARELSWTTRLEAELGGFGSMSQREQEILFSTYGPRHVRKEMRQRRRAREQRSRERNG